MAEISASDGLPLSALDGARAIPPIGDASLAIWSAPFAEPQTLTVAAGTPLRDTRPAGPGAVMLRVNGEWLLQDQWGLPALPGDMIEWHAVLHGGNASRSILLIVAIIAIALLQPQLLAAFGPTGAAVASAGLSIAASVLINAVVPLQTGDQGAGFNGQSPQSVYNTSASGNQARLGQPIPVIYGRHLIFPDFASQPYAEYEANDQFYKAVFCIGYGSFFTERIQIDDTDISSFRDVTYAILPPGQQPTLVNPAVVTALEVSGGDLKSGIFLGPFAACGPTLSATHLGFDILFQGGLGTIRDDGSFGPKSVSVRFEARNIDDFGVAIGAWFFIGTETITRETNTPQRVSFKYKLPTAARVETRVVRTDVRDTNSRVLNDVAWGGLRAYLKTDAATVFEPTATYFELSMRASEQLNGLSQRKISLVVRRRLRTWLPSAGWSAPAETRSIAWALADVLQNPVYGGQRPDSEVDLQTLYELDQVWTARQDRLDIIFDSRITVWDAAQTVAQAGRAMPFRRYGICTLVRDQLQTLPVAGFSSRKMLPGASIAYSLATPSTADGVIVEYFSGRAWDWRDIDCPAPGRTVRSATDPRYDASLPPMSNAVRLRMRGITGSKHAEREGLYQAAQNLYRRRFPKFQTEMAGLLPSYGSAVTVAPALAGWGQSGDVAAWNAGSRVMGLSEPPKFVSGASHYISLFRDDGSVTDPIPVSPGAGEREIVLAVAPDFALVLDDGMRDRPKYIFGASGEHRMMAKVLGIARRGKSAEGAPIIEISTVVDDPRAHSADARLLPAANEVQDPVDGGQAVSGSGTTGTTGPERFPIVYLTDNAAVSNNAPSGQRADFTLTSAGAAVLVDSTRGTVSPAEQWLRVHPVETSVAARFDVRATLLPSGGFTESGPVVDPAPFGDALNVWLSLGTTRNWYVDADANSGYMRVRLGIEIREVSSGTVQTTNTITLEAFNVFL